MIDKMFLNLLRTNYTLQNFGTKKLLELIILLSLEIFKDYALICKDIFRLLSESTTIFPLYIFL